MRQEDYTSSAAMTVRRQPAGYWAASPNKLPPVIEPSWELIGALSDAGRYLSELGGIARTLPNPHLLIDPFLRKEAVLSSKIEGTQASLSDLFVFEATGGSVEGTSDVKDVASYIRALNFAFEAMQTLPISVRLFKQIHEILITDPTKTPGELRTSQNWIGFEGCTLAEASYVPPPPGELLTYLGDLENYLHCEGELPALVKYAIVHYQFESIHPFLDGNGRLGRLLITLLLCADPVLETPLLSQPLLYLSAYLERHRQTYYERLDAVSKRGEWVPWILFFLRGVSEQARDAVQKSDQLLNLRAGFDARIREHRGSALVHQISDRLFVTPIISIAEMARVFGRTYRGSQLAVSKLVELGIVEETYTRTSKLYVAREVVRIVDE
jgi:Fic family protein